MTKPVATLTIVAILSACAGTPPKGFVADQWGDNLAELGIFPVFPPREDFQVGDVYFAINDRQPNRVRRPLIWFDSVNVVEAADTFYRQRPSFPAFTDPPQNNGGPQTADAGLPAFVPQPTNQDPIFASGSRANRLRLAQFPGFNVANLTYADLGVAAPVSGINALLGLSGSNETVLTVAVPQAESYALPAGEALRLLIARCTAQSGYYSRATMNFFKGMFPPANEPPYLIYITEVFYARSLDYFFSGADAVALAAAATLPDLGALSAGLKDLAQAAVNAAAQTAPSGPPSSQPSGAGAGTGGTTTGAGSDGGAPRQPTPADLAQRARSLAERAEAMQSAAAGLPAPGIRAAVRAAGSRGITLRQTFERPIAIGFRGLTLTPAALSADGKQACNFVAAPSAEPGDVMPAPAETTRPPRPPPRPPR